MKHIIGGIPAPPSAHVPPQVKTLTIDEDGAGQRLDNYLMRHLKGVPKTHVYRIIRSGEVRVNKGRASAETRLNAGDEVRVPPVRISERVAEKAQAMAEQVASHVPAKAFAVLFEDDSLLAINKPAGVAVHGGSGVSFGVIEQLRMARPQAKFLELVHRLDRETSGILLVAKKRSALKNLQDQFRERETGKTYLAMVIGQWPANKKVLDKPLHKYLLPDGERRVKVVAKDDPDGMPSLTLVKVRAAGGVVPGTHQAPVSSDRGYSLLEVTIKTGRTHQIRVHLASEGLPIVGDDKYGDFDSNKALARANSTTPLKRMFLHAWRLQCNHPATGERLELQANLPTELAQFVQQILPQAS
ncbi:RluA family pseudouridine synthase [Rhodoferax sp. AJA081-3]|uniref:RluA family pseudouridine synthase n=1 Tax=Rhodoferax sp. AJA081-3 TaxID=2752316 RepID=UPI001ADFB8EA|nr:RluA family pseudouridine synthase [Rhodoferax sp. AJA081-3]QTN29805.1 RluA family pseudouridine synthase [Rhodoferax sp. AJA081-3]